jgi:gliding motility-associated-like protein
VSQSTQLEIIGANDQPTGNNVTINQVTVNGSNALVPLIEGLGVSSAVPGIDPDADSIQYVLDPTSNVANGQFQFQNDGSFVFVPNNDYFGEQEFKYFVKDQTGVEQGPYVVKIVIRENPDIDGVPSVLEMLGDAGAGDVNGDGVPDRKQNNITTFPLSSYNEFQAALDWANDSTKVKPSPTSVGSLMVGYLPSDVTSLKDTSLKLDPYAKFSNVSLDQKPSLSDSTSTVKKFATDIYNFQIEPMFGQHLTDMDGDANNGLQTRVVINFPVGIKASTYLKKNKQGKWFSFVDDQNLSTWDEGATLVNLDRDSTTIERIILTIKDGGLGDFDGIVNDTIVDPGALGEMAPLITGKNLGIYNESQNTNLLLHDINEDLTNTDFDAQNQKLTYKYANGTDTLIQKAIAINAATGKLTVKLKDDFDFESFVDANGKAIVQFTILASNKIGYSDTANFSIELLNLDEYPKILNGRTLSFTEKDTVSIPVVQIKALPDYQDITTFEILNEMDASSFNINKNTGIVKFNISPIYKVKKLYQFAIKALDNLGHTDTAHFDVNIIPLPPPPVIGDTAIYKLDAINAPTTFTNLVSKPADGSEIRWRFAETSANNWVDTIPRMPDSVGRYNYIIKTFDPITGLFSKDSSIVNIVIRPYDPIVKDSTYIIGAKNNPTNISIQVKGMPRNTFNFYNIDSTLLKSSSNNGIKSYQYNVSAISTTAPSLPNVPGKFKYAVNQIVNTVESDTLPFIVNMIEQRDIVQVYYKIDTPILLANSTFNVPMEVIITNKLSKPIDSVQVQTIVKDMMPIGSEFKVVSIESTGNIKVDTKFDGVSNVNLIAPNVIAPPLSVDTVKLIVNIIPNGFTGTLKNSVTLTGKSVYGWVDVKSSKTIDGSTTEMTPVFIPEVFLKIPEIYTPNRDGINDNFVIVRPYGMKIELEVFNRWGSVVYTNSDYQNEWDGKGSGSFLGQDLVDGGYYYKIRTRNTKGETQLFNGYVVIQR